MEPVKIESGDTLIQTYFQTYEEVESSDGNTTVIREVEVDENEGSEDGTYYIDEQGRYYYQPGVSGQNVAPNVQVPVSEISGNAYEPSLAEGHKIAGNEFSAVRISETDVGGEVSYILIVQPENDVNKESDPVQAEHELGIYDFDDDENAKAIYVSDEEDDKSKIKKLPVKTKLSVARHSCTYCNYTSSRRYLLARHMKSHNEERPHKCSVCEKGFKTVASLQNHVNTHTGNKPHLCKYCTTSFTTSGELVRHVRYRHTHEKPHKCSECDYASVELSKLKRHIRCHTGERPYQCPHCTYASPDTFKLKRHLRTHTGEKPYVCNFCNMAFSQSNSLKAHKLIHNISAKPVFPCELCPTTCGRKTDLRIHIQKLHTSYEAIKCKRCGKSLPDRYSFKLHNKTHEGEKCYKCDMCPYASISQRHLSTHMLKHTDEKPFSCSRCDQSFRQKQLLRRHENLYHNPEYVPTPPKEKSHECSACGRHFAHKGNLIRHMAIHDPNSDIHAKALSLKMGRAKRVAYVDVPMQPEDEDTEGDDEEEAELNEIDGDVQMGTEDQQYVVLEVINLPGENGEEQQLTIVGPPHTQTHVDDVHSDAAGMGDTDYLRDHNVSLSIKVENDMDKCFGFDEDGEDDEEDQEEDIGENKQAMRLITQNEF